MKRLHTKGVAEQIRKQFGNIAAVARAFGVSSTAVRRYVNRRPKLRELLDEVRHDMDDNVQSRYYADCLKDDPAYQTSRIFYMKVRLGWKEPARLEITGADGGPIKHEDANEAALRAKLEELTDAFIGAATREEADAGSGEAQGDLPPNGKP